MANTNTDNARSTENARPPGVSAPAASGTICSTPAAAATVTTLREIRTELPLRSVPGINRPKREHSRCPTRRERFAVG